MRRGGPSSLAIGIGVLVVALVATWLSFAKDVPLLNEPYEIDAAFLDTSGIAPRSPVRIAGVDVGEVTRVRPTSPGAQSATVTLAIRDRGRPVHRDATAKIRPRIFLEGNFFVDLLPGTRGAGELADGAMLPAGQTSSPVQLDEVLRALKSDTRNDLRRVFREVGTAQQAGGARAFNASLPIQPGAYRFTAIVAEALLGRRPGELGDVVRDGGIVASAINDPRRLRALIADFDATAAALADRESALTAAVGELPRTLRAATPALDELAAAFPAVRELARGARPGVRSLGPTVDSVLPLTVQLRGLVRDDELGGLARNLRSATPPLAQVAKTGTSVLEQLRALASCTSNVLVPFGDDRLVDRAFPSTGPVHEELAKWLPGLAGESRSFDANAQYFKVLGSGGAQTLSLGNGIFGSVVEPLVGVNPPGQRTRPPLKPDVPCETQQPPDLRSVAHGPPRALTTRTSAARAREQRAQSVAVALLRRQLRREGRSTKVLDRPITIAEIRALAQRNGLTAQLERALRKVGGG